VIIGQRLHDGGRYDVAYAEESRQLKNPEHVLALAGMLCVDMYSRPRWPPPPESHPDLIQLSSIKTELNPTELHRAEIHLLLVTNQVPGRCLACCNVYLYYHDTILEV
jgi:hypothetical protein